jgi:hypothetical protein
MEMVRPCHSSGPDHRIALRPVLDLAISGVRDRRMKQSQTEHKFFCNNSFKQR